MSEPAERYTLEGEADVRGYVTAIRVSDNRRARVKLAWLKRVSDISGEWMPRSRTKAIRLAYFCEWQ
jgi:hypothetical protein